MPPALRAGEPHGGCPALSQNACAILTQNTPRSRALIQGWAAKARAYNPGMLDALHALVAPAAMERFTLVLNHVLSGEPAATARLKRHAGRCIGLHLSQWPALLPVPPAMVFRVTPAGLLEWAGAEPPADTDLHVTLDASNPALLAMRWLSGQQPAMEIVGDAALASDVHWLADNLRWDVADDLERLFGPVVARELSRLGSLIAGTFRRAAQAGAGFASRAAPNADRSPWSNPRPQ